MPCAQLASLSPLNGMSLKRDFILWLVCVETGRSAFPVCFLRAESEVFITDKNSQRGELDKLFLFLLPKDIAFTIWKLCFQIRFPLLNSSPSRAGNEHNSFCIIFAYHKTWYKTYSQSQIEYLKWNQSDVTERVSNIGNQIVYIGRTLQTRKQKPSFHCNLVEEMKPEYNTVCF